MRSTGVVEDQISAQALSGRRHAVVGAQVDFLVFDRPPQAFDEDVVAPCALAIHADLDAGVLQRLDEVDGGELRSLIRVHNLGFAVFPHRLAQRFKARPGLQRDRQAPGQHLAAEPVDDSNEIDEAAPHGDIGDVHRPDLIRLGYRQLPQQIRIDLVAWRGFRCVRLTIERLDPHALH